VVLLGDKAVGKSSIASRFCFDKVYRMHLSVVPIRI
jgi:GTPase SAR1 family protein